jgi:hypothetical protein
MKTCKQCNKTKTTEEFGINNSKFDGLQTMCKICKKEYNRKYYVSNPNRGSRKAGADRLRDKNREYVYAYLNSHPCVDCGETNWRVLEFDHIGDDKTYNVGIIISSHKLDTVKDEIAKCEVRCRNCHFLVTQERLNSWRVWFKPKE